MRILLAVLVTIIAGCSAQPKCVYIPNEGCKTINAGNVGGTTLGHHNDEDLPAKAASIKP